MLFDNSSFLQKIPLISISYSIVMYDIEKRKSGDFENVIIPLFKKGTGNWSTELTSYFSGTFSFTARLQM
jgi:hypothetical protein